MSESPKWEFFLAHAASDVGAAEGLYVLLSPSARVFLDTKCLSPGDDWDQVLPQAQATSSISIILISPNTPKAYYQREEIASAIAMSRAGNHRVVPVYLQGWPSDPGHIPYGLRIKQGLMVPDEGGLDGVATKLLLLRDKLKG